MKTVLRLGIVFIYHISFFMMILLGIIGILYEVVGYAKCQETMSQLGMPVGIKQYWIVGQLY